VLEGKLFKYFEETQNSNTVSHKTLQLQAPETVQSLNIAGNKFKAGTGWIDRFMKRKNLPLRTITPLCATSYPLISQVVILFTTIIK
jgi:hypothetical protein